MTVVTVTSLSKDAATTLVEDIRSSFEAAWDHYANGCRQLVEAYQGRAWEPLGLSSWAEFVTHTLDVEHLRIPKAERLEFVRVLTEGGLSLRDVSAAIGVAKSTVQRDLEYVSQMGQRQAMVEAFGSLGAVREFCQEIGAGPCALTAGVDAAITDGDKSRENIGSHIKEAVERERRIADSIIIVSDSTSQLEADERVRPWYQLIGTIQGLTSNLEQNDWTQPPAVASAMAEAAMRALRTALTRTIPRLRNSSGRSTARITPKPTPNRREHPPKGGTGV